MREKPILFSGTMVRAILNGTKTQTRRVVKLPSIIVEPGEPDATSVGWLKDHEDGPGWYGWMTEYPEEGSIPIHCPYGQAGDVLFVRESFSYARGQSIADRGPVWYWADGAPPHGDWTRPKPSIHMPRWASRITLEVTDVRVERLQDISEEDALAEGVETWRGGWDTKTAATMFLGGTRARVATGGRGTSTRLFYLLWESIHGPGSWEANPWVWAVSFKRLENGNVD